MLSFFRRLAATLVVLALLATMAGALPPPNTRLPVKAMLNPNAGFPMEGVLTVESPVAKEVAAFAAQQWGQSANNLEAFTPGRIASVHVQRGSSPADADKYELEVEFEGEMGTTRLMRVEVGRSASGDMELLTSATLFTLTMDESLGKPKDADPARGPQPVLAGGFSSPRVDAASPELRSAAVELARARAANAALEEGAALVLCEASQQVVAGMNYKLSLGLGACDDAATVFSGRVFCSLQGQFKARLNP